MAFTSKIPTLTRTRIPIANQQENKIPQQIRFNKKTSFVKNPDKTKLSQSVPKKANASIVGANVFVPKPMFENIDCDSNCYLLSDYVSDIYKYLREVEV